MTAWNNPGYEFSQARIFSYKCKIVHSIIMQENTGQRGHKFWHILHCVLRILRIL